MDRLIEFGFGMGIAQQMINSMNQSLQNMHIPGAMNKVGVSTQNLYFVVIGEKSVGPLSESELSRLIHEKRISKETFVWMPGMSKWQIAENVPEVLRLVALSPPPFKEEENR